MSSRKERDTLGEIEVDNDAYWGAQTQRSLSFFAITDEVFPKVLIYALVLIKKAAASVNQRLGVLGEERGQLITQVCDEILLGKHDTQFPLRVWQTGSGTQSNMNVNEVIANRANEIAGSVLGSKQPVHPNDHVNCSQSSNDVFPTAMHIATAQISDQDLLPALGNIINVLEDLISEWGQVELVGRTHMMDALPLSFDNIFSAYIYQLQAARDALEAALEDVYLLALGGTAVGTGANAPAGFAQTAAEELAQLTGLPFTSHPNKFAALSAQDGLVRFSSGLKQLATVLFKIACDIRLQASGPRCGLGEFLLPANEPGSSIMPGKVNPTQCEALSMVSLEVFGNDAAVAIAASMGPLQLNVYRPLIIHNVLRSIRLLADSMNSFSAYCLKGLQVNEKKVSLNQRNNLMIITLVAPEIGYDKAAKIARYATDNELDLVASAEALGLFSREEFEGIMKKVR